VRRAGDGLEMKSCNIRIANRAKTQDPRTNKPLTNHLYRGELPVKAALAGDGNGDTIIARNANAKNSEVVIP